MSTKRFEQSEMAMPSQPVQSVAVSAPSRLHLGMFSFGQAGVRQFGGVGAMIQSPRVLVSARPADRFTVTGMHAERTRRFAERVVDNLRRERGLGIELGDLNMVLDVQQAPREHIGLGLGTQLGLAVAAAICGACDLPRLPAIDLARLAGRGARSAIGTHGFEHGGLLVEAGKHAGDEISPLVARLELPALWRFLLIMPKYESGLAGGDEQQAFARLPAVPLATTDRLVREALLHLLPAAATANFDEFSASLYRFGHLAGSCFAREQGGAFAGQRTAQIVERLRTLGVQGVGQSSWGPTVFVLCENETAAEELLSQARSIVPASDDEFVVSAPANHGATIEVVREPSAP